MDSPIIIIITIIVGIGAFALAYLIFRKKSEDQTTANIQQQLIALQDVLRSSFENTQNRLDEHLKNNAQQMQITHKTVGERLDTVSKTVGERLDNATRTVNVLGERMLKVEEATLRVLEVGKDISSLQDILRAPKMRGGLGEIFLADLLGQMLPQDSYELQYSFKDGERVDAVIKTAHGLVPIDSKFPLEDFQRSLSADTDEQRKINRRGFVESVKRRVNESAKYIRQGEGTFDFALMYIPAENIYYDIITRNETLGETDAPLAYAMKKKVIPVSPNTFYAYLNTILLGLKGMRVEKFVAEIIKEMGRIKNDFGRFKDDFSKIGKHISNASSAYDSADKRLGRLDDRMTTLDQPVTAELDASPEETSVSLRGA
ncbi:MAG: DNA recombination protein RmuC [Pseudomonadota bacterium]